MCPFAMVVGWCKLPLPLTATSRLYSSVSLSWSAACILRLHTAPTHTLMRWYRGQRQMVQGGGQDQGLTHSFTLVRSVPMLRELRSSCRLSRLMLSASMHTCVVGHTSAAQQANPMRTHAIASAVSAALRTLSMLCASSNTTMLSRSISLDTIDAIFGSSRYCT